MQNIRNFIQCVINHLRSEIKYIRGSFVSQLQLAARGRNYYSGLKRTFRSIRKEKWLWRDEIKKKKTKQRVMWKRSEAISLSINSVTKIVTLSLDS